MTSELDTAAADSLLKTVLVWLVCTFAALTLLTVLVFVTIGGL
jgi:hypothetical protein